MSQPAFSEKPDLITRGPQSERKNEQIIKPEAFLDIILPQKKYADIIQGVDKTTPFKVEITGPLQNTNIAFALKINDQIAFLGNFPQFQLLERANEKEYVNGWKRLNQLTQNDNLTTDQLKKIFIFLPKKIDPIEIEAFKSWLKKSLSVKEVDDQLFEQTEYEGTDTAVIVDPLAKRFVIAELELQRHDPNQPQIKRKPQGKIMTKNY